MTKRKDPATLKLHNGGRKGRLLTEEELQKAARLSGFGFNQKQICISLQIPERTWIDILKRQPTIPAILAKGKIDRDDWVTDCLMKAIDKGSVPAIIFYKKCQSHWREDQPPIVESENKKLPAITLSVNDPIEAARIYQEIMQGKSNGDNSSSG